MSYEAHKLAEEDSLVPPDHMAFYNCLRPYIELKDCYLVHTGFLPGVDTREQTLEDIIWIRKPFIHSTYDFGKRVIFGHTPLYEPLVMENKIGLHTSAVYGLRLTCLELPEMRFHSIEA